jgi:hypothetical protein
MKNRLLLPLFCLFLGVSSALGAPSNDNFANAVVINGTYGQVAGTTVGATNEAGEPNQRGGGVWYRWKAPNSLGRLTLAVEVFDGVWFRGHWLDIFQNVTGSIFDVIPRGAFYIGNQSIRSESIVVSPNTTYYFRVAPSFSDSDTSPIQFTLNFSPIYRSAAGFVTRASVLRGSRQPIVARIYSPANVGRVAVVSRGKGRARSVRYTPRTGVVRFTHVRTGGRPRGRRALSRANVTYTIIGTKAGQVSVRVSRRFAVR